MEGRRLEPVESEQTDGQTAEKKTTQPVTQPDAAHNGEDGAPQPPRRSGTWKTLLLIVMTVVACVLAGLLYAQRDLATRLDAVDSRLVASKLEVAQARSELAAERAHTESLEDSLSSIHRLSGVLLEDLTELQTLSAVGLSPKADDAQDLDVLIIDEPIELGNIAVDSIDVSAPPPKAAEEFGASTPAAEADEASRLATDPSPGLGSAGAADFDIDVAPMAPPVSAIGEPSATQEAVGK